MILQKMGAAADEFRLGIHDVLMHLSGAATQQMVVKAFVVSEIEAQPLQFRFQTPVRFR